MKRIKATIAIALAALCLAGCTTTTPSGLDKDHVIQWLPPVEVTP